MCKIGLKLVALPRLLTPGFGFEQRRNARIGRREPIGLPSDRIGVSGADFITHAVDEGSKITGLRFNWIDSEGEYG